MRLPSFVHQAIALPTLACDAQYAPSASHARTLSQQRHIAWPNLATSSPPRSEAVPGPIAASFRPWPCLDLSIPSLAHAKEGREPLATATASPTHSRSLSLPYAHTTPTSLSLSLSCRYLPRKTGRKRDPAAAHPIPAASNRRHSHVSPSPPRRDHRRRRKPRAWRTVHPNMTRIGARNLTCAPS